MPEVPFNSTRFFICNDVLSLPIHRDILKLQVLHPHFAPFKDLMMKRSRDLIPAYVPDITDLKSQNPLIAMLVRWLILNREEGKGLLPKEFEFMMDPSPVLSAEREQFLLLPRELQLKIGSFTNALRILQVVRVYQAIEIHVVTRVNALANTRMNEASLVPSLVAQNPAEEDPVDRNPPLPATLSLLVWNARGLSRLGFRYNIDHLIRCHRADILLITETRASRVHMLSILMHLPYDHFLYAEPDGTVGGILPLWKSNRVSFTSTSNSVHAIHAKLEASEVGVTGEPNIFQYMARD